MRYWVIKGNPFANDWDRMLEPGAEGEWYAGRIPTGWAAGDRLFCWESTPALRVVGLAVLAAVAPGFDEDGYRSFRVRYLTRRLESMPTISELRRVPVLNTASFLKSGPATTLFPLTDEQASVLLNIVVTRNPQVAQVWPDIHIAPWSGFVPDVDEMIAAVEGRVKLVAHFVRERNRTLVERKKEAALRALGRLECEVCGFDFAAVYPGIGDGFCEVHHRVPLSRLGDDVMTRLDDLAIVCSNCHRMLHRQVPFATVEGLRRMMPTRTSRVPCRTTSSPSSPRRG